MQQFAFDLDSPQLAEEYRHASPLLFRAGQRLVRQLDLAPGSRVLDVGCGTGLLAEYVLKLVGSEGQVVGIDPLPLRIGIASRRRRTNLQFRVGTAEDLSEFPSEFFDAAYLHAVLHWLPDPIRPFRQLQRVLKPGGFLGITTSCSEGENTFAEVWREILSRPPYTDYPAARQVADSRFSKDRVAAMLADAAFDVRHLEVEPTTVEWESPEEAIRFVETISAGNLLGHFPLGLREPARKQLARALNRLREPGGICLRGMRLLVIAERRKCGTLPDGSESQK